MELYVIRHGHAPLLAGADFNRELDARGRTEVMSSASLLADIPIDLLATSPLVRAVQTAALIRQIIGYKQQVKVWPEAVPGGKLTHLLDRVSGAGANRILLVSHQPLVSNMVDYLTGEKIHMDTAAAVGLHMDIIARGCGEIIFRGLK